MQYLYQSLHVKDDHKQHIIDGKLNVVFQLIIFVPVGTDWLHLFYNANNIYKTKQAVRKKYTEFREFFYKKEMAHRLESCFPLQDP